MPGRGVNRAGEEVDLDVLEELRKPRRADCSFEQGLQPVRLLQLGEASLVFLVEPVRDHAGLGDVVHLAGADLHLDRHAEGPIRVVCRTGSRWPWGWP